MSDHLTIRPPAGMTVDEFRALLAAMIPGAVVAPPALPIPTGTLREYTRKVREDEQECGEAATMRDRMHKIEAAARDVLTHCNLYRGAICSRVEENEDGYCSLCRAVHGGS